MPPAVPLLCPSVFPKAPSRRRAHTGHRQTVGLREALRQNKGRLSLQRKAQAGDWAAEQWVGLGAGGEAKAPPGHDGQLRQLSEAAKGQRMYLGLRLRTGRSIRASYVRQSFQPLGPRLLASGGGGKRL
eukprot:scaffold1861_cov111-Isochrysis_galbana.AAC.14